VIAGIAVLAAGGIAAAIAVTSGGHRRAPAVSAQSFAPAAASSPTPTTTAPTVAESAVREVLAQYETDYSQENAEGLKALFASGLERQNGSQPSEDLEQALATYRKQFSEQRSPSYRLSGISVQPEEGEATAWARYTITNQNGTLSGSIVFHFTEENGQLLVDRLTIEPSK
jgi:hypothetical protein